MKISEATTLIGIRIVRVLAYILFPVGTFLFFLLILSIHARTLGPQTFANVCLEVLAILLFFGPPPVILFLHPPRNCPMLIANQAAGQQAPIMENRYGKNILVMFFLAVAGILPLVFLLISFITIFSSL